MGVSDKVLGSEQEARASSGRGSDVWRSINALDPTLVGDRLGIERDGKRIKRCPSCGADAGVDYVTGGWKCLHASCSGMGKNGFRTNVDCIMEMLSCSALEAAKWSADTFGTVKPEVGKRPYPANDVLSDDDLPADYYDKLGKSIPEAVEESTPPKQQTIFNVLPKPETKVGMGDGIRAAFTAVQERMERGSTLAGIESGFKQLDYALDGWGRKRMYVLAGRAGMGKSIVGLNLALRFSEAGHRALYFTHEMTNEEQILRALFSRARVGMWRMKKNKLYRPHWDALTAAAAELSRLPIHFDEAVGLTDADIERRVIAHKREHGDLFCVVVDHTLLVHGTNERQPRREQLNSIVERFKNIAKEQDVCMVALTQINRSTEARNVKDKRPQMSDLKETGAFEEFADAALLLYREDYYHYKDPHYCPTNTIEVIIPKVRGGQGRTLTLKFIGSQYRIDPPDDDEPEDEESGTTDGLSE